MELRNQPVQGADVVMETEGHIEACATASASRTLRSQSPSACQYVHRTGPGRPSCCPSGPGEEGPGRTLTMHDTRESDNGIVPQKPPNQEQLCLTEGAEGRPLTKGNMLQSPAARTQSRGPASRGLWRVRQAAKRDKHLRFTALFHHLTLERLCESFYALERQAAPGVDGVTWDSYKANLGENLRALQARLHQGRYRTQPLRRVYIPKVDGTQRPLGIACLEDKIVQQAVVSVLSAIYESDFVGFSYGFRPGRGPHDALDALAVGLVKQKVWWVLDADIQQFYDTLDRHWLRRFLQHRIGDKRLLRLINKWLEIDIIDEDGQKTKPTQGIAQGLVIGPLLSNLYLHYVFDLWSQAWRKKRASGDVIIARFADDIVLGFQYRQEAAHFKDELAERLGAFGLTLHPVKTRLIEFGRFAAERRQQRGQGKPETFEFLGFVHICSQRLRDQRFTVKRRTIKKRMRKQLQAIKAALLRRRHDPVPYLGAWLRRVVQGHYNYYGVPGNMQSLKSFQTQVERYWFRALRRRSQRRRMAWSRFRSLAKQWIPKPQIVHPYPDTRFYARHPR
jgi:RNA-directed DNA polymerase